jgi:imidazolonepropionase-like amidohydrolase
MFRNVRIFNGTDPALSEPSDVTVTGNLITQIRPTAVNPAPQPSQQVLDGTGKTLIPGLIDAHVHLMFAALAPQDAFTADESYIHIAAAANAKEMLLRGFTTVRDAGGPTFGLKRAIDEGSSPGRGSIRPGRSSPKAAATATSGCATKFPAEPADTSAPVNTAAPRSSPTAKRPCCRAPGNN